MKVLVMALGTGGSWYEAGVVDAGTIVDGVKQVADRHRESDVFVGANLDNAVQATRTVSTSFTKYTPPVAPAI